MIIGRLRMHFKRENINFRIKRSRIFLLNQIYELEPCLAIPLGMNTINNLTKSLAQKTANLKWQPYSFHFFGQSSTEIFCGRIFIDVRYQCVRCWQSSMTIVSYLVNCQQLYTTVFFLYFAHSPLYFSDDCLPAGNEWEMGTVQDAGRSCGASCSTCSQCHS